MQTKDWINIVAIALSPVIAVLVTLLYQKRSERIKTQKDLFLTLMKYRRSIDIPLEYVDALNCIDIVFHNNRQVTSLWAQYCDNLHSPHPDFEKRGHLQIDLLSAIATHLGYSRLKQTQIDRYYEPQFVLDKKIRQQQISDELLRTLKASENYGSPRKSDDNKLIDI